LWKKVGLTWRDMVSAVPGERGVPAEQRQRCLCVYVVGAAGSIAVSCGELGSSLTKVVPDHTMKAVETRGQCGEVLKT
jgi:hypothetical protein